jgi:hypothetical protein
MRSTWLFALVVVSVAALVGCGSSSGNGGTGGSGGASAGSGGTTGGTGGVCGACAVADRASLCPTGVATASMCPSQGVTCCDANDQQWQCGNCVAETCHWGHSCVQSGTGGSAGSGAGGAGGSAGQGGGGHGGAGGQAGSGGQGSQSTDGGPSCTQLMTQYSNAFPAALDCTPGASNQCMQQALSPTCTSSCYTIVNNATAVNALRDELVGQGCTHPAPCPCALPTSSACVATDAGSAMGKCMPVTN